MNAVGVRQMDRENEQTSEREREWIREKKKKDTLFVNYK